MRAINFAIFPLILVFTAILAAPVFGQQLTITAEVTDVPQDPCVTEALLVCPAELSIAIGVAPSPLEFDGIQPYGEWRIEAWPTALGSQNTLTTSLGFRFFIAQEQEISLQRSFANCYDGACNKGASYTMLRYRWAHQ